MCNNTGLWATVCAQCNSKENSSQRGEDIERKAWEKDQERLDILRSQSTGHADSRQNGLRYRIATQAVAPGLV